MNTADLGLTNDEAFFRDRLRRDAGRLFQSQGESKLECLFVAQNSNGRANSENLAITICQALNRPRNHNKTSGQLDQLSSS